MRRDRSRGADRRVRHVTGTGVHVRLGLVHAGVGTAGRIVGGEWSVLLLLLLLLSTCMHVLVDAVLTLVQRLLG